jgi:hypothetical protein
VGLNFDYAKRLQILSLILEGGALPEVARIASVSEKNVNTLFRRANAACRTYQDEKFTGLSSTSLSIKAIWAPMLLGPRVRGAKVDDDIWAWIAVDRAGLVPHWRLGRRDRATARSFAGGLVARFRTRPELSWDHEMHDDLKGLDRDESSPAADARRIREAPHLEADIFGLHVMRYNFSRINPATGVTPAMASGIERRPWLAHDIMSVVDNWHLRSRGIAIR